MNQSNVNRAKQARQEQKQRGRDVAAARRQVEKQQLLGYKFLVSRGLPSAGADKR